MKNSINRIALWVAVVILAVAASSCSAKKMAERLSQQIAVEAVENISGSLDGGWIVKLRVRNDSNLNPTLSAGEGDIYLDGVRVAHASLLSPVTLPKHATSIIAIPLNISIYNPLKALSLMLKFSQRNFDGIDIAFSAHIKAGAIDRTIGSERVAANLLLKNLGLNN